MFEEYPDILTEKDLEKALGIGRNTAYSLLKSNLIGHFKVGKQYRIPKYALIKYASKI